MYLYLIVTSFFLFSKVFCVIYGLSDFFIFPEVLHSFEGVVVVGGQQIGKTRFRKDPIFESRF